jgi:hypothetical protein
MCGTVWLATPPKSSDATTYLCMQQEQQPTQQLKQHHHHRQQKQQQKPEEWQVRAVNMPYLIGISVRSVYGTRFRSGLIHVG